MLASNGYFPLISLPTRVTAVSSTKIDHLIMNDHKNIIFPGIIKTDLIGHYPIFYYRGCYQLQQNKSKGIQT